MAASLAAVLLTLQKEETVAVESCPNQTDFPTLLHLHHTLSQTNSYTNEQSTAFWEWKGQDGFRGGGVTMHWHELQTAASSPSCCKAYVDFLLSRRSISTFWSHFNSFGTPSWWQIHEGLYISTAGKVSLSHVCSPVYVASCPWLLRALRPDPGTQAHLSPAAENWVTAQPKASGSV